MTVDPDTEATAMLPPENPDNTPTRISGPKSSSLARITTTSGSGRFVSGTVLVDRYRIIGLLGKGGMGEVYRAEDMKLGQEVALKFLPDELNANEDAIRRFHGEVRNARQISHSNVCRVFDIGDADGRHFISMEFIEGDDLSSLLTRVGRLPNERAIQISRQLCAGLAAIHKAGILHRDLKPPNIIIDRHGDARITDFGIAAVEAEIEGLEVRAGTAAYMSPEQITGKEVTVRSDIYSLGLVLYEIFTGRQAFIADSIPEYIKKHKSEVPITPSDHVKDIDPIVETVIAQCLEKDPANRPENALQVAMALPGGDPLQYALEAGHTPTPEMVAAMPKKGQLRPWLAIVLFIACIAAFSTLIYIRAVYSLDAYTPFEKSPAILAEIAKKIARDDGYTEPPIDTDSKLITRNHYIKYVETQENQVEGVALLREGQPSHYQFRYRQSPNYLTTLGNVQIDGTNPPMTTPGEVAIRLDVTGRLIEFLAVPAVEINEQAPVFTDWKRLFDQAGLDQTKFKETKMTWTTPTAVRATAAWEGTLPGASHAPIRVEAAEFNGLPVYFEVVPTQWEEHKTSEQLSADSKSKEVLPTFALVLIGALIALFCFALFLVFRNVKAGRGDIKGAAKIAIFCLVLFVVGQLLVSDAPPTLTRLVVIFDSMAWGLLASMTMFCFYLAVEPYIRRRWPETLISWNRILMGKWRDPMIGRDILVGSLVSCVSIVLDYGVRYLNFTKDPKLYVRFITHLADTAADNPTAVLNGQLGAVSEILGRIETNIFGALLLLLVLLVFTFIFRKRYLALIALSIGMGIFILGPDFNSIYEVIFAFAWAGVYVFVLARFGLVALIAGTLAGVINYPGTVTLDTSSFHFPSTFILLGYVFLVLVYALYVSLSGQKLAAGKFLDY